MQDNNLAEMPAQPVIDTPNNEAVSNSSNSVVKKRRPSLNDLVFMRIFDPIHIPSYLVEQLKDRLYEVDKFYAYQRIACTFHPPEGGMKLNPTNLLYSLVNEKLKQVKGFLWMVVDILSDSLVIQNFSIDKEYWHKGDSIALLEEKAKKVRQDLSLKRIVWVTKHPKFCEARGFKRSKDTVMIYEEI